MKEGGRRVSALQTPAARLDHPERPVRRMGCRRRLSVSLWAVIFQYPGRMCGVLPDTGFSRGPSDEKEEDDRGSSSLFLFIFFPSGLFQN